MKQSKNQTNFLVCMTVNVYPAFSLETLIQEATHLGFRELSIVMF